MSESHRPRRLPLRSALLTGGALGILVALASGAPALAGGPADRPATITRGGLTVAIPPRGMGVRASALMVNGTERELQVETRADGGVAVLVEPGVSASASGQPWTSSSVSRSASPASSANACQDTARSVFGQWWHSSFHWSFKSASKPSNISVASTELELKRAVRNITGEHNDCGRPDQVSATSTYDGRTTHSPQIGADSSCSGHDGQSVVGFGDLSTATLAFTCWWYVGDTTVEADMRLNKHGFAWAVSPTSCSNAFIIEGVATHEFGHAYGLGHVSQTTHANLTMSTAIFACDSSDATLGLGDMLGLETHY